MLGLKSSPSDPYLLFGVLVLLVGSIFGAALLVQHQAALENQRTLQLTIRRPLASPPAHQQRRVKRPSPQQ